MPIKIPVKIGASDDLATMRRKISDLIRHIERQGAGSGSTQVNVLGGGGGSGSGSSSGTGLEVRDDTSAVSINPTEILTFDLDTGLVVASPGFQEAVVSLSQDIRATASPEFAGLTLTGFAGLMKATAGVVSADATWDDVPVEVIATPTIDNLGALMGQHLSHGLLSGGTLSDAGSNQVAIAAGEGLFRTANAVGDNIAVGEWGGLTTTAIADGTTKYIFMDYNSGSPTYSLQDTVDVDDLRLFRLGWVTREGSTLHIMNAYEPAYNFMHKVNHSMSEVFGFRRADLIGGLIIGETGTRNPTLSAGEVYFGPTEWDIDAVDCSGAGRFTRYYPVSGVWTASTGNAQWPNDQYSDGTDLQNLTVNRYGNLWFYVDVEDNELIMLYGTSNAATQTIAEAEAPPSSVPDRVSSHCILLGRILFKQGASTATLIQTAFNTQFNAAGVSDHGDLAGLADDDHTQYLHLTSARSVDVTHTWTENQTFQKSVPSSGFNAILMQNTAARATGNVVSVIWRLTGNSVHNDWTVQAIQAASDNASSFRISYGTQQFQISSSGVHEITTTDFDFSNYGTGAHDVWIINYYVGGLSATNASRLNFGTSIFNTTFIRFSIGQYQYAAVDGSIRLDIEIDGNDIVTFSTGKVVTFYGNFQSGDWTTTGLNYTYSTKILSVKNSVASNVYSGVYIENSASNATGRGAALVLKNTNAATPEWRIQARTVVSPTNSNNLEFVYGSTQMIHMDVRSVAGAPNINYVFTAFTLLYNQSAGDVFFLIANLASRAIGNSASLGLQLNGDTQNRYSLIHYQLSTTDNDSVLRFVAPDSSIDGLWLRSGVLQWIGGDVQVVRSNSAAANFLSVENSASRATGNLAQLHLKLTANSTSVSFYFEHYQASSSDNDTLFIMRRPDGGEIWRAWSYSSVAFAGSVKIGGSSAPAYALDVTGAGFVRTGAASGEQNVLYLGNWTDTTTYQHILATNDDGDQSLKFYATRWTGRWGFWRGDPGGNVQVMDFFGAYDNNTFFILYNPRTRTAGTYTDILFQLDANSAPQFRLGHYQISSSDNDSDFRLTLPSTTVGIIFDRSGNLDLYNGGSGSVLKVAGTQVVTARQTGWTDQTATASRADLGASPTVGALASFCRALYDDLKTHGLIGN